MAGKRTDPSTNQSPYQEDYHQPIKEDPTPANVVNSPLHPVNLSEVLENQQNGCYNGQDNK